MSGQGIGRMARAAALPRAHAERSSSVVRRLPPQERLRVAALRAGLAVLPPPLLQCVLDAATAELLRRRPAIPERLARWHGASVLIKPADAPVGFVLRIAGPPAGCRLRVVSLRETVAANARIECTLVALIDLLEGHSDGDALFFGRDLAISGDTELIVGLRNALDGTEIDLLDGVPEPLAAAARAVADVLNSAAEYTEAKLESWRSWLVDTGPADRDTAGRVADGARPATPSQGRSHRQP